jgi:hypothetical protein
MKNASRSASPSKSRRHGSVKQPPVLVSTEHKRITNLAEAQHFLSALAAAPPGIVLRERLQSKDSSKDVFVWQGETMVLLKKYLGNYFGRAVVTTVIGNLPYIIYPPNITSLYMYSSITQGGRVAVGGMHFGKYDPTKSHFRLVGTIPSGVLGAFPNLIAGQPTLELQVTKDHSGRPQWSDSVAVGTIPGPLEVPGLLDQNAFLQIVAVNGKVSDPWPVQFKAQRQVIRIPFSQFRTVACGDGDNTCGGGPSFTVAAVHGAMYSSSSGTDFYSCQLQNQYIYDHYEWAVADGINGGPFGGDPDPVGSDTINLKVSWFYDFSGTSVYALNVFAIGPIGITGGW